MQANSPEPVERKLERLPQPNRTGLSKSQRFALMREGKFPKPIKCGRSSLFISAEIDAWIDERISASRAGQS